MEYLDSTGTQDKVCTLLGFVGLLFGQKDQNDFLDANATLVTELSGLLLVGDGHSVLFCCIF